MTVDNTADFPRSGSFEEKVRGFGRRGKQELVSPPPEPCE